MAYTALRSLALTVEESSADGFRWVLLERFEESENFEILVTAEDLFRSYGEALRKGVEMLSALADGNMLVGPRAHLEDLPLFVETERPGLYNLLDD